ncbi:MAG: hypothetical protein ABEN55_23460 [Bradymonadaceae bacterium]
MRVAIDNTTIRHSDAYGLRIADDVTITSFDGNTITNNKTAALATQRGAGHLSGNSSFEGNEDSWIEIDGEGGDITQEVTWPAIEGADYLLPDGAKVKGSDAHLTIEPGATLIFGQQAGLIAKGGKLTAEGTSDKRIVFTGKEETKGYWAGLQYNGTNSTDNVLKHVTIEYGGGSKWPGYSGAEPANLLLNDWSGDVRATLNNATIGHSGNAGIRIANNNNNASKIEGCSKVTFEKNAGSDVAPEEASCPTP